MENRAFNQAVGSYERMVRPAGEKIQKLGGTVTARNWPTYSRSIQRCVCRLKSETWISRICTDGTVKPERRSPTRHESETRISRIYTN